MRRRRRGRDDSVGFLYLFANDALRPSPCFKFGRTCDLKQRVVKYRRDALALYGPIVMQMWNFHAAWVLWNTRERALADIEKNILTGLRMVPAFKCLPFSPLSRIEAPRKRSKTEWFAGGVDVGLLWVEDLLAAAKVKCEPVAIQIGHAPDNYETGVSLAFPRTSIAAHPFDF